MKAHEEFQRKYVFTPQMERVITYSNDDKVKMLVVTYISIIGSGVLLHLWTGSPF